MRRRNAAPATAATLACIPRSWLGFLVIDSQFTSHLVAINGLHGIHKRGLSTVLSLVDKESETLGLTSSLVKP